MTAQAAEPLGAILTYLATTSVQSVVAPDASTSTGSALYRPKLPEQADLPEQMPFACIVARTAGGYALFGGGNVPAADPRVEFRCYASDDLDAKRIANELALALRRLKFAPVRIFEGVRFYWARIEAGPMPLDDPDSDWPTAFLSAQVAHTEVALA